MNSWWSSIGVMLGLSLFEAIAGDRILMGDPASERAHAVRAENSRVVGMVYPKLSFMTVRASGFEDGFEPWKVLDGDPKTHWQVRGNPPPPMQRGQWIEVELDNPTDIPSVSVQWWGDRPYKFSVQSKPWEDFRKIQLEAQSSGHGNKMETFRLPTPVRTRAIRIEFSPDAQSVPQGISEIRLGGVEWPRASPLAVDPPGPVFKTIRPYYVEFERMLWWPVFQLRRALADGGTARILLPDKEKFEGGRIDFDLAVEPVRPVWVTLKLWEPHGQLPGPKDQVILLETLSGDVTQRHRTFLPRFVTEEQNWVQEWYGTKPIPGRWVYAHYELPEDFTRGTGTLRFGLRGVGNSRRDMPMREASPPVYEIRGGINPWIPESSP